MTSDNIASLNTERVDMATAAAALRTFSGTEVEDVAQWMKEVKLLCRMMKLADG